MATQQRSNGAKTRRIGEAVLASAPVSTPRVHADFANLGDSRARLRAETRGLAVLNLLPCVQSRLRKVLAQLASQLSNDVAAARVVVQRVNSRQKPSHAIGKQAL